MEKDLEKLMPWRDVCKKENIDEKNVIAVLLYGSQNYNLHTENSDFDFKIIILPPLNDLFLGKPLYVKEVAVEETGSKCVIHDIRHFTLKGLKNQNINFLETLFTDYAIYPNEKLKNLFTFFYLNNRESIAHSNLAKFAYSICGQCHHTSLYKTGKALSKIIYFYEVLKRLNDSENNDTYLKKIWISDEHDVDLKKTILSFKANNFFSENIAKLYLEKIDLEVSKIRQNYSDKHTFDFDLTLVNFMELAYKNI